MTPTRPPDVVLITCHDLGRHVGCYGVDSVHTPNIDRLAAEGCTFAHAFCVAPQCSPSRAALATGRYPHNNGVMGLSHRGYGWELAATERHLARLFSELAYETHLFGHQHVTQQVERLGFGHVHEERYARDVCSQVADFITGADESAPSYTEVNLFEPHRPYDHGGVRPDTSRGVFVPGYLPDGAAAYEEMAALQGAIRAADDGIGRIISALDHSGRSQTTFVAFTSDHGLAMPRAKCTLYDPGLEVALLMRWPEGGLPAGSLLPELVSNIDVAPTLLEAAGGRVPEFMQGRSLLALLRNGRHDPRDVIFAEKTFHSYYDPMRALRSDRYKLILNFEASFAVEVPADVQEGAIFRSAVERYSRGAHPDVELYDLTTDPLESKNLAGDPEHEDTRRALEAPLRAWMEDTGDPLLEGPVRSPTHRQAVAGGSA